ncbi:MAG: aminotransferase class I/II-fold pyridoxal phosphate-dependent enzyme [Lachnospiraceae bacterium]|nr:aminotransferase class I/II-fold pyridoxal phosphate-dependent enzyme [Lachnospiraceae bacterium]
MKYDFTTIMDRRGKDASAVDAIGKTGPMSMPAPKEGFDPIPMWVADMNFPTVPTITEAIIRRAKHPAFGYFALTDEYFDSIIRWHQARNGVSDLNRECIGYQNGVLGGVVSALNVLCSKGDHVLLHSPTYIGFTMSLKNNGYEIVHSPLVKDKNGMMRMDYEDMEKKIVENQIHATILCSPHNPCGRVWEKWELEKAMDLFRKYDVYVISDEIWSDIILNGYKHIPTQSVSEDAKKRTIAFYAPSKTFNLAGLVGSYHIIYHPWLRDRMKKECSLSHYNDMNVLSMHALIGAYKPEGHVWLDELRQTITANVNFATDYIKNHFPGVEFSRPQGTYMLFLDCSKWCGEHGKTIDQLQKAGYDVGVVWQDGRDFGGPCHIRLNLALPLSRVEEAFSRLEKYVFC